MITLVENETLFFFFRESRRFKAASRSWKKNLRQNVSLAPRLRGSGPTLPGRSRSSDTGWTRPVEPLTPRWSSTRRGRMRSPS